MKVLLILAISTALVVNMCEGRRHHRHRHRYKKITFYPKYYYYNAYYNPYDYWPYTNRQLNLPYLVGVPPRKVRHGVVVRPLRQPMDNKEPVSSTVSNNGEDEFSENMKFLAILSVYMPHLLKDIVNTVGDPSEEVNNEVPATPLRRKEGNNGPGVDTAGNNEDKILDEHIEFLTLISKYMPNLLRTAVQTL